VIKWGDTARLTADDETGELFEDGRKVTTTSKLAWPERLWVTIATASSFVIAFMAVLNSFLK